MKKIILTLALLALALPALAQELTLPSLEDTYLTGDTRLACEAILCLSSGTRPGECSKALARYFNITRRLFSDTLRARRSFLRLCPDSGAPGMEGLTATLAKAAGRCTADILNRSTAYGLTLDITEDKGRWYNPCLYTNRDDDCRGGWTTEPARYTKSVTVRSDQAPDYCRAYQGHEWTYQVGASYQGTPPPEGVCFTYPCGGEAMRTCVSYKVPVSGTTSQVQAKIQQITSGKWVD